MEISALYDLFLQHPRITTDTRKLLEGDIFFALKGPLFNGNDFAKIALDKGAAYVVVDETLGFFDNRIITTGNTLATLQQLAKHHREQFNSVNGRGVPFIAITGSNGKTTTKELVHAVLSSAYKTYTTEGNLNNHIGIPLTILKIKDDAEIAVIEMGANNPKEIEGYCRYVQPTHGLITNFGKAHLEGFGSIEGVRKAKGELFDYLRLNNGTAFVNADDAIMMAMTGGIMNVITYGTHNGSVTGKAVSTSSFLTVTITGDMPIDNISTQLVGEYNLPNILAAATIGKYFNVGSGRIKSAIEAYIPSNSRSQMIRRDSNTIVLDAYNANPDSMKAAIENFSKMIGDNKILILGSMAELGEESPQEHQDLVNMIKRFNWREVILVGKGFINTDNPYLTFADAAGANQWFKRQEYKNASILIKGSRSMQMEKVLE